MTLNLASIRETFGAVLRNQSSAAWYKSRTHAEAVRLRKETEAKVRAAQHPLVKISRAELSFASGEERLAAAFEVDKAIGKRAKRQAQQDALINFRLRLLEKYRSEGGLSNKGWDIPKPEDDVLSEVCFDED
jgi:hypothetical protein